MNRYRQISAFAVGFAAEYKGFMAANGITNLDVAAVLGRADSYVSERASGKRPLDTDDIDALASLVDGWDGKSLTIELARRARGTSTGQPIARIGLAAVDPATAPLDGEQMAASTDRSEVTIDGDHIGDESQDV